MEHDTSTGRQKAFMSTFTLRHEQSRFVRGVTRRVSLATWNRLSKRILAPKSVGSQRVNVGMRQCTNRSSAMKKPQYPDSKLFDRERSEGWINTGRSSLSLVSVLDKRSSSHARHELPFVSKVRPRISRTPNSLVACQVSLRSMSLRR